MLATTASNERIYFILFMMFTFIQALIRGNSAIVHDEKKRRPALPERIFLIRFQSSLFEMHWDEKLMYAYLPS